MNKDKLTTWAGLTAVVAGVLYERKIYPEFTGLVAAIAASLFSYWTNKLDRTYLR